MARPVLASVFHLEPFDASEDPDAAPGAYKGEDAAPAWTARRAYQNMIWIYVVGLVFLVFSVSTLLESDPSGLQWVVRVGTLVMIAVAYVSAAWVCDAPLWLRWCYLTAFVLLLVSSHPFMGWGFLYYGVYVSVMTSMIIPWRHARVAILVVGLVNIAAALAVQEWAAISIGLTGLFVGYATGAGIEAGRLSRKLDRSRQRVSVLAVSAERERIGRDLHDILGHSLTAISIKAGLAGKLVEQDAAAARREIADVEDIARQALADVRATASGYREVRVATEIASARSVLLAAGIEARVPSALEPVSAEVSELFGYVVREAVTNVVRHSEATTCTIEVTREAVSVRDDGRGFTRSSTSCGTGLDGLAARLESVGGRLVVTSAPGTGTVVWAGIAAAEPAGEAATAPVTTEAAGASP